jgi:hypothetical protein
MATLPSLLQASAAPLTFSLPQIGTASPSLAVNIPHQEQDWWCWCAIAVGIEAYYSHQLPISQCKAAERILKVPTACANPTSSQVNVMHRLDSALAEFNRFNGPTIQGALKFSEIETEIKAGRPVGARILFKNSGIAHFTVIRGCNSSTKMLHIDDPLYDENEVTYQNFVNRYRGWGEWLQTYLTRA